MDQLETSLNYFDLLLKSHSISEGRFLKFFGNKKVEYSVDLKYCMWYTAEITLKFNLTEFNSQNFPKASLQTPHINKIHKIK